MRQHRSSTSLLTIAIHATFALIVAGASYGQSAINDAMPQAPTGFPSGPGVSTKTNAWYNLSREYQTRPGLGSIAGIDEDSIFDIDSPYNRGQAWLAPISSQVNTGSVTGTVGLVKVANADGGYALSSFNANGTTKAGAVWNSTSTIGAYPSSKSLYNQGNSTAPNTLAATLGIFESTPLAGLSDISLQLEIGPAYDYDLLNNNVASLTEGDTFSSGSLASIGLSLNLTFDDESTLSLNADSGLLVKKVFSHKEFQVVDGVLTELDVYIHLYDFRWDLLAYDNITAFNITFDVVDHSQLYMVRLDQAALPIPEPSTWLLIGAGTLGIAALKRRRSK